MIAIFFIARYVIPTRARCQNDLQNRITQPKRAADQASKPSQGASYATRDDAIQLADDIAARRDLDEAWEIAERGPMPLFLANIHLYRARLFGPHAPAAIDEPYPWESPTADLAAARRLIEKHGYLRRKEELEDAEATARNWAGQSKYPLPVAQPGRRFSPCDDR